MKQTLAVCTIIMVLCIAFTSQVEGQGRRIVLLPFYDESGYRGPWKLTYEVPTMLGDMLMDEYYYVVPMDTVKALMAPPAKKGFFSRVFSIFSNSKQKQKVLTDGEIISFARQLQTDYAIIGVIDKFTYKRTGGGEPMIGGYKSYTATVAVSQVRVLNVSNGKVIATARGEDDKNSRGLGLELFGKPRRLDMEFMSLDSLDFGSKRFLNTLLGQAVVEALNNAQKDIKNAITQPDNAWFKEKKFKILSIENGVVTINAGSADGVNSGDQFNVYASESETMVGKINLTSVWSDHISRAEILDGKDAIRLNDYILPSR
ncbi:hypothetical protein LLG96_03670 [bacterium]|nr:hypothetical protein [bacterium]